MKVLNEQEMLECNGGAKLSAGVVGLVVGIVSFILGIIDGYTNPKKCN